jgi:hypothetical protein
MEAASARVRIGAWERWRRAEAAIEARSTAAYAAEGIGTFLLVFFICSVISVGNAGVLRLDLAGLEMLHASGSYADFWVYNAGPFPGALAAALAARALVLARQTNTTPMEVSR